MSSPRHLGSAFQIRQVSIQLIFRDSFAAVELLDAAPDLCVDCFPVLHELTILFFLVSNKPSESLHTIHFTSSTFSRASLYVPKFFATAFSVG
jgi:hypothetical protein